jgi:predicted transcriptional regulator
LELKIKIGNNDWTNSVINGSGKWHVELGGDFSPGVWTVIASVGLPGEISLNTTQVQFEIIPRPLDIQVVVLSSTPFVIIILSLVMVVMTDMGMYKFTGLFIIPLYTRIKKEKVLDRFTRGQIYQFIKNNPGETYNSIKRGVSLSNGSTTYHLRVLEREGLVHSKRNGTFRHFYPASMKLPKKVFRLSPVQKAMIEILRESPGISQVRLSEETGMTTSALNYHVKLLSEAGIIKKKREGMGTACYLNKVEISDME